MTAFLLSLLLIASPTQPNQSDTPRLSVIAFNQLIDSAFKKHDTTTHICYVYGYYAEGRYPMLISGLALLRRTSPIPDSLCILMRGNGVDSIKSLGHPNQYERALVETYITLKLPPYFPPGTDASKLIHYIYIRPRIIKQ
jgi:hypothetical protein